MGLRAFVGALISAILSTVDSALLSAASLTSHNLLVHLRPDASDAFKLWLARGGVVCFGLIAWWLATQADTVHDLVQSASSFCSAGIVVVGSFGLFTSLGGPRSATFALLVSALVWLYDAFVVSLGAPFVVALVSALMAYLVVASRERATAHPPLT